VVGQYASRFQGQLEEVRGIIEQNERGRAEFEAAEKARRARQKPGM